MPVQYFGRWVASLALAWLLGLGLQLQAGALPARTPFLIAVALTCMLILASVWMHFRFVALHGSPRHEAQQGLPSQWRLRVLWCVGLSCVFALAWTSTTWRAQHRLDQRWPSQLEGVKLKVHGQVTDMPRRTAQGWQFPFNIEAAESLPMSIRRPKRGTGGQARTLALGTEDSTAAVTGMTLQLNWWAPDGATATSAAPAALTALQSRLQAGQRWTFLIKAKRVHAPFNPHGLDVELLAFEAGRAGTASVQLEFEPVLVSEAQGHWLARWRQAARDHLLQSVPNPRAAGLMAALAVGDQAAIPVSDWRVFQRTGISHLVSISGMHVTMFAVLASALWAHLWRRSQRLMSWWPTPLAASWCGLWVCALYVGLSGAGVPSQRTWFMLAAVTALKAWVGHWPWPLVLMLAAVAVTVLDPWSLLSPGFALSFMAVALLMSSGRDSSTMQVRAWARTHWVSTVGLAPLTLVVFHQVSAVGWLANAVAIPVVTLLITPMAMLGLLVTPLWHLGAWCIELAWPGLQALSDLPWAVWQGSAVPWWAQWAALLSGAVWAMPAPAHLKVMALAWVVPAGYPPVPAPPPGHFEITAIDVGQGSAVLVRTHRHTLLYDTGPAWQNETDAGERLVLPYLHARAIRHLDMLVISHSDLDHVGGATSVVQGVAAASMHSSLSPQHPLVLQLQAMGAITRPCQAGQTWQWDGVEFEFLHPDASLLAAAHQPAIANESGRMSKPVAPNALSCVLKVQARTEGEVNVESVRALIPGDLEKAGEAALVAQWGKGLRSEVLLVPHHGSNTSSSPGFLEAVRPRWAVVQSGYLNRYGHPTAAVIERYRQSDAQPVLSTSCGAWQWRSDIPTPTCWRDQAARYWHTPG